MQFNFLMKLYEQLIKMCFHHSSHSVSAFYGHSNEFITLCWM